MKVSAFKWCCKLNRNGCSKLSGLDFQTQAW